MEALFGNDKRKKKKQRKTAEKRNSGQINEQSRFAVEMKLRKMLKRKCVRRND